MKISKRYSYKSQLNVLKHFLNSPPNGAHKTTFGVFENLSFSFLTIFFWKIANSPLYPMEKSKTSIIWKTSDHRAKRSEIWDSLVVLQHIYGTFGL